MMREQEVKLSQAVGTMWPPEPVILATPPRSNPHERLLGYCISRIQSDILIQKLIAETGDPGLEARANAAPPSSLALRSACGMQV